MRIKVFILLFLALYSLVYASDDIKAIFFMGNYFYEQGNYDEAIKQYNRILEVGLESGNLYYNLGNCYFKKGQIGKAILNYEKALRIMPVDSDLISNYRYALSLIKGPNIYSKKVLFFRLLENLFDKLSIDGLTVMLSVFYLLSLVFILLGMFFRAIRRYALILVMISVVTFMIGMIFLQRKISLLNKEAIVVVESVDVKFEPKESATTYFTLYEGAKVNIVSSQDNWYKIRRQDNKIGWIDSRAIEIF